MHQILYFPSFRGFSIDVFFLLNFKLFHLLLFCEELLSHRKVSSVEEVPVTPVGPLFGALIVHGQKVREQNCVKVMIIINILIPVICQISGATLAQH